jgi:hypothetical protein
MKGYFLLLNAVAFVNWTEAQIVAEILCVCMFGVNCEQEGRRI